MSKSNNKITDNLIFSIKNSVHFYYKIGWASQSIVEKLVYKKVSNPKLFSENQFQYILLLKPLYLDQFNDSGLEKQ